MGKGPGPELKLGSALGYHDGSGIALQESTAILKVEGKARPASAVSRVGLVSDILGFVTRTVRCGDQFEPAGSLSRGEAGLALGTLEAILESIPEEKGRRKT